MYADRIRKLAGMMPPKSADPATRSYLEALNNTLMSIFGGCFPLSQDGVTDIMADFNNAGPGEGVDTGALNVTNANHYGEGYAIKTGGTIYAAPGVNNKPFTAVNFDGVPILEAHAGDRVAQPPNNGVRGFVFVGAPFLMANQPLVLGIDPDFTGTVPAATGNLLSNPGLEEGSHLDNPPTGWGNDGFRYAGVFSAGAASLLAVTGSVGTNQTIDISGYASAIDAGEVNVRAKVAVTMHSTSNVATTSYTIRFINGDTSVTSSNLTTNNDYLIRRRSGWGYFEHVYAVPTGTRSLELRIISNGLGGTNPHADECWLSLEPVLGTTGESSPTLIGGPVTIEGATSLNGPTVLEEGEQFTPNTSLAQQMIMLGYMKNLGP